MFEINYNQVSSSLRFPINVFLQDVTINGITAPTIVSEFCTLINA